MENDGPSVGSRFKSFLIQCKRVWHLLRKPTNEEFKMTSKISALGLGAIGLLGFIIGDLIRILFKNSL